MSSDAMRVKEATVRYLATAEVHDVPLGYRPSEVGAIPEDWDVVTLGECLDLLTDFEANGSFADVAKNVKVSKQEGFAWYVRATDLENHTPLEEVRYVDELSYLFLKKTMLHGGEVLITKRGEIGNVYFFQMCTLHATLAPNLYLLKLNERVLPAFVYYYFRYGGGNESLKVINASTTLGALYKNDVKNLKLPLPPNKAEQHAIAEALSDVDGLLGALDVLIAKKRAIKQGAMQQLLTGKTRLPGFSEEWRVKQLGDMVKIDRGQIITEKCIRPGSIPVVAGGKQASYHHDIPNRSGKTITISASGANAGFVNLYSIPIFASDCSTICEAPTYSITFLYFLLQSQQERIYRAQTGGAQPHIHARDIAPLQFHIPRLAEQDAIAAVLSEIDAEIEALETRRDKTRAVKQGMMQQLLTGRIRLPVAENA